MGTGEHVNKVRTECVQIRLNAPALRDEFQVTIMDICITSDACDTWGTLLQLETEEHVREALRNGIGDLGRRETG
jgi:hypothetical protein